MSGVFNCLEDLIEAENGGRRAAAADVSPSLSKESQFKRGHEEDVNKLRGSHRRSAHCIEVETKRLVEAFGVEHIAFITLTFVDQTLSIKECARRFNSFMTGFLRERVVRGIRVLERNKGAAIHYHLVVALREDIRSGVVFEELKANVWTSAPLALRNWWKLLRETLPKYGFGWHQLYPIEKPDAIGAYVGKYIAKHITLRVAEDKGARRVSFFGFKPGERQSSPQFAFEKGFPKVWRAALGDFCKARGIAEEDFQIKLRKHYGPRWAFFLQNQILEGSKGPTGIVFPKGAFSSAWHRPSTSGKGGGSTQRAANQNASACQPEAKNFPDSGKKPVARAMADFQEALRLQARPLPFESVGMQQQIGFPQLAGTEAGQKETHS